MSDLHTEMKDRAERALGGTRNSEDLYRILMWLRGRTKGSIRDIGDFLAHFDERNRGHATEEMIDYMLFTKLKFLSADRTMAPRDGRSFFAFDSMPQGFEIGIKAALRVIGVKRISETSGIMEFRIPLMISDICSKAFLNPDGTMSLMERCSDEERGLLRQLIGNNDFRSLYTLDNLFNDFIKNLVNSNVLRRDDARISSIKDFFGAFICKSLDGCKISRDGIKGKLIAYVSPQGTVLVMAKSLLHKTKSGGSYTHLAPIFWTELEAKKVMTNRCLKQLANFKAERGALEINSSGLIDFI